MPLTALADDLAVTVYNSNLGVISETRKLPFKKGANSLAFRDVPALIDVNSVRFGLAETGKNVTILEQNYGFDLVSSDQIYSRYVDKEIELIDKEGKLYSGTLLSSGGGNVVLQDKNGAVKIVLLANISEVNFPSLPDGLITRPTLFWLYQSDVEGDLDAKVSYQTNGMDWTAEYVGVVNPDETKLNVSGWAAINNTSGKTYREAALRLVAGAISRAYPPRQPMAKRSDAAMLEAAAGAGFEEKAFFEYHLYTLPRKATLADKEVKQISLFEPAQTNIEKKYQYKPDQNPRNIEVVFKFKNSKESGLGLPLPAGRVRLFKADTDGSMILLGEDAINHTPRDEELSLKVGTAFDVVADERVMNQIQISSKVQDQEMEMEIRNRKDQAVTVDIEKNLYGNWQILQADFQWAKKDAYRITASVPVNPGETKVLKFKVRYSER
jgi:hypothetical protein